MAATHFSGPVVEGTGRLKRITSAYTVTYDDDGILFYIGTDVTGYAITMPAYKEGFSCEFKVAAPFTTDYVITWPAAICYGPILENGAVQVCAAASTFTLEDDAEARGDYLKFECIADIVMVEGMFTQAASITVA